MGISRNTVRCQRVETGAKGTISEKMEAETNSIFVSSFSRNDVKSVALLARVKL